MQKIVGLLLCGLPNFWSFAASLAKNFMAPFSDLLSGADLFIWDTKDPENYESLSWFISTSIEITVYFPITRLNISPVASVVENNNTYSFIGN